MSEQLPSSPSLGKYYGTALAAALSGTAVGTIIGCLNGQPSAINLRTGVSIFAFLYVAAQASSASSRWWYSSLSTCSRSAKRATNLLKPKEGARVGKEATSRANSVGPRRGRRKRRTRVQRHERRPRQG